MLSILKVSWLHTFSYIYIIFINIWLIMITLITCFFFSSLKICVSRVHSSYGTLWWEVRAVIFITWVPRVLTYGSFLYHLSELPALYHSLWTFSRRTNARTTKGKVGIQPCIFKASGRPFATRAKILTQPKS